MTDCACGCGAVLPPPRHWTELARYRPGHDRKHGAAVYNRLKDLLPCDPAVAQAAVDRAYAELTSDKQRRELTSWLTKRGSSQVIEAVAASGVVLPTFDD